MLKIIEHLVFVQKYIPVRELETLVKMLRDLPDENLGSLVLGTLNKLVRLAVQMDFE